MQLNSLERKKLIQEIEDKVKYYSENKDENININLFYPVFDTIEKREQSEIFGKYKGLTMKDMIHSDYLTRDFCDWCFNVYEWNYECCACGRGDDEKFFDCIPPMLLDSKYQHITSMSITHSKITKIEYIPSKVESLDLSCNQIDKIENIPESVEHLELGSNKIKKIENLPSLITIFKIHSNPITKLEGLPKTLNTFTICSDKILEYGDLSHLENTFTLNHNPSNNLLKVPLVNLNLIVDYYPKGYREIQYINTINLQNHYFKKWRSFVLNQKDKKQYNHFLSPFDDEISKLSNLLFYIIIRDHNQYYVKNLKDTNVYLRYRCYENKADLIKKKIENFRDKYIERKSLGINILMNELCILIRDRMKPFYNKRIKIILTPHTHLQVEKKREFQVKKYLNPEEIRKVFPPDTQERELLDYFLDEIKNFQNNNYFTFLKNSQNYILRYPFYTSDEMLTPFLDISGYSFEFFSNEELVDSEYEQNSNDDLLEDNLFD